MKMKKKWSAYLLIFTMSVSGIQHTNLVKAEDSHGETSIEKTGENLLRQEEKEVRVIVELEKDSLLEEANKRNLPYSALGEQLVEEKQNELKAEQETLLSELEEAEIEADTSDIRNYDTVLNGVAFRVKQSDIEKLEKVSGVKEVYVADEFERPLLNSSSELIGANQAWENLGYQGEGTVVAVVDTGVDYSHKALQLEEGTKVKLPLSAMERLIGEKNLPGSTFTTKVPYGYNYYDFNTNLFDSYGSMHGMHVAGIVGANDKENGIVGVAPKAQILAMKVFSDDVQYPTTFTDIWLNAIDDAISLGADVVNMSLGSPAGFSIEGRSYPETEMIEKARKAGVTVVVAAGNEGKLGDGNTYGVDIFEENFDTALIANPSLHEGTLSVASMENTMRHTSYFSWSAMAGLMSGEEEIDLAEGEGSLDHDITGKVILLDEQKIEKEEEQKKIAGNIVTTELYTSTTDKKKYLDYIKKIVDFGPAAILFYNSEQEAEKIGRTIRIEGEETKLTIGRMRRSSFERIKPYLLNKRNMVDVTVHMDKKTVPNVRGGKMSTFSSWGPSPDLRIKPEVTAPGGAIYSTIEDNAYKNMSGTSMASPQVAGAGALIKEALMKKGWKNENAADLTKLLLMNTAKPLKNENQIPYFVRQQGSGVIDLVDALSTNVVVRAEGTNDTIADGKLELRELKEKKFFVNLKLENLGEETKKYTLRTRLLTEEVENGRRKAIPKLITAPQAADQRIVSVSGHSTETLSFELDYTTVDDICMNSFIEGFLELHEVKEGENPTDASLQDGDSLRLNVPFLGFYGNWGSAKAIDAFRVKEKDAGERRAIQFYVNKDENIPSSLFITSTKIPLPIMGDTLYFSPTGEYHKDLAVRIAPLRNMESIEYSILDGVTGETLRVLGKSLNVRKLNRLTVNNSFLIMPDSRWDGRIDGIFANEGKDYVYQMKAKLNTNGVTAENEQIYQYPVRVDVAAPEFIGDVTVKDATGRSRLKTVTLCVKDSGTGIEDVYLNSLRFVKGGKVGTLPPGIDDSAPGQGKKPKKTDGEKSESSETKKVHPLGSPKYGKFLRLTFVDRALSEDGTKILPMIVEGKVVLDASILPKGGGEDAHIFINRNGHRNQEIEIVTPYVADTTHLYLTVKDRLSNKKSLTVETGETLNLNTVSFLNYRDFEENGVSVKINGKKSDTYQYTFEEDKAEIEFSMNPQKHLSFLSVKQNSETKILLKDSKLQPAAKRFKLHAEKNAGKGNPVRFTIENIQSNCEVVTVFKDGEMPTLHLKNPIKINLTKIRPENFEWFRNDTNEVLLDKMNSFTVENPDLQLYMKMKNETKEKVLGVLLHKKSGETEVLQRVGFPGELENGRHGQRGKDGYYYSNKSTYLYLKLRSMVEEDTEIEVVYEGSETARLLRSFGNDLMEDKYKNNTSKKKYPIIFLESPSLLSMIPNNRENKIRVEGFVGNVKDGDRVKKLTVSLVDAKGRIIGETEVFTENEIETKPKNFAYHGKKYSGLGYVFEKELTVTNYFANIRIEAETVKGEIASIVRRAFYDFEDPSIFYEIKKRTLDSETVTISLKGSDDSLRLRLFEGDSLIDVVDKTAQTLSKGGVELQRELTLPLKIGQNTLRFKAIDLTGYVTEKIVHIYRIPVKKQVK